MIRGLAWRILSAAALLAVLSRAAQEAAPRTENIVELHPDRMPRHLWPRELVWLHNIGVDTVAAGEAPAEFRSLAAAAGLTIVPVPSKASAISISALSASSVVESRRAILARKTVLWTDVESDVWPAFRPGAVALGGDESPSLQALRRESLVWSYWSNVLVSHEAGRLLSMPEKLPDSITCAPRVTAKASVLSVVNSGKQPWRGALRAYLPTYKRDVQIPDVTVPGGDALLLPVDVSLSDPLYCRQCSGMSNSERLLYATAELTAIEYENGILSFEFYAPTAGSAVLYLEREPNGPMLAGGRPVAFDWDADNKRAKLPIPEGKGAAKRTRIAITMTAPDEVASFDSVRALVIGQKNRVTTDYTSEALAKRSRLIAPEGWKTESEVKSPTQIVYTVKPPPAKLHGDHVDLRLEADGVGMSHVRVQLLRPVSVHVAEAGAVHFGTSAELATDPPVIAVEGPNGRNIAIQLRNNAPEIRTFQVEIAGDGLEFSPATTEISIGASVEREISTRVFASHAAPGPHHAEIRITGPITYNKAVIFIVIPRGETVSYTADLLDTGAPQAVWENAKIRAVFDRADGGRWIEFYWKESGKSLLPADGVPLTKPVKMELNGDTLAIVGATGLPKGGKVGNVEWLSRVEGGATKYIVSESTKAP